VVLMGNELSDLIISQFGTVKGLQK